MNNLREFSYRRTFVFWAILVLLAVASCGQSDTPSTPLVNAAELDGESPIDTYFGEFTGSGGALEAWRGRVEMHVAECMKLAGFNYMPGFEPGNSPQDVDRNLLSDDEWRAQYGYGVVSATIEVAQATGTIDPNVEIINALSPGEREAYMMALLGEVDPTSGRSLDPSDAGCTGEAIDRFGGQELFGQMDTFVADRARALERLSARPEMNSAQTKWQECIATAGYDFATHSEAEESMVAEAAAVVAPVQQELGAMSAVDRDAAFTDGLDTLPSFPTDELARLQEREIAIALADSSCFKLHVEPVWLPLRNEVELELLEDNRQSLEELRSALSSP